MTRKIVDAKGNVIPGWKLFWTVFGSSNQLLAAMVLFGLSIWLFKLRMKFKITLLPAIFMIVIALSSLFLIIKPWLIRIMTQGFTPDPVGLTCIALFILTFLLLIEGISIFLKGAKN